jgi:hypothetical protein
MVVVSAKGAAPAKGSTNGAAPNPYSADEDEAGGSVDTRA